MMLAQYGNMLSSIVVYFAQSHREAKRPARGVRWLDRFLPTNGGLRRHLVDRVFDTPRSKSGAESTHACALARHSMLLDKICLN